MFGTRARRQCSGWQGESGWFSFTSLAQTWYFSSVARHSTRSTRTGTIRVSSSSSSSLMSTAVLQARQHLHCQSAASSQFASNFTKITSSVLVLLELLRTSCIHTCRLQSICPLDFCTFGCVSGRGATKSTVVSCARPPGQARVSGRASAATADRRIRDGQGRFHDDERHTCAPCAALRQ